MLVLLCGCCVLSYEGEIRNYIEGSNIQKYGTYDLHLIDRNDINYARLIFPIDEDKIPVQTDTYDLQPASVPRSVTDQPNQFNQPNTQNSITQSIQASQSNPSSVLSQPNVLSKDLSTSTKETNPTITSGPNKLLTDDELLPDYDNNKDFGYDLPWDKEIGFCEVLKGTDRDLYSNVVDDTIITFY